MPRIPILMPQLGESIAEAVITEFLVAPGDEVAMDQDIIEVETSKATMAVTSPCSGRIDAFDVEPDESYPVGSVLGHILASEEEVKNHGLTPVEASKAASGEQASGGGSSSDEGREGAQARESMAVKPTVKGLPVPANVTGASYLSPRMKARMTELGLHAADLAGIAGSGAAGRVTIQDFEAFIERIERKKTSPASSMRVAVADAMRRSWTRPIATVGLEVTLDPMLDHRRQQTSKPGPTLYALRALALALAENRAPAGRLIGKKIVHPSSIDISFAVEAEDGVLVPVIRNAEQYSLQELHPLYMNLLELARERRLPPDATRGSIATVTNFGTFGLTWATPIPLPEQTLVLGMGAGKKTPHWDEEKEAFVPVTKAYLTLSFDHRVLDGGAAGRLLNRVATLICAPESL